MTSSGRRILVFGDEAGFIPFLRGLVTDAATDPGMWAPAALERLIADPPAVYDLVEVTSSSEALQRTQEATAAGNPFAIACVAFHPTGGWDGLLTIQQLWREQPDLQVILCRKSGEGTWDQITARLGQTDALAIISAPWDPVLVRQQLCAMTRKWTAGRKSGERTEELRQAQRQVQAVIDYLPSPICLRDLEGRFLLTNGAFRQHFRTTSEAVFGRRPEDALPAGTAWLFPPLDDQVVQGDKPVEYEVIQPAAGDHLATAWLVGKWPLHGNDGRPSAICSLFTDLSRRKAEEDRLRHGLALRAQVRMAAELGHQVGNLLTHLGGNAAVALRRLPGDHPATSPLAEVLQAVAQGGDLARQLTLFGRRAALHLEEADLRGLVVAQVEVLRGILPTGRIGAPRLPAQPVPVRIDPVQFAASFLDVVLAVADAQSLDCGVQIAGHGDTAQAEVWIVYGNDDDGAATKAADPFIGPGEGGHLGPAAARVLCEQLGGTATRRLTPTGRLALVLALPVAQAVAPPVVPLPPVGGPPTVLVAEDEAAVLALVAEVLRDAGFRVLVASDGQEALNIAWSSAVPIDLLVADAIMPRLDGLALAERVLARHPTAKVLMMSGYTEGMAVRHGLRRLTASFLQKPFTLDGLLSAVITLIGPLSPPVGVIRARTPMYDLPVLLER